jgi:hypothetical protein
MVFKYWFDFVVTDENGEEYAALFPVDIEASSATMAEAQMAALWRHHLLPVLPSGRVGGGYYREGELPEGFEDD